MSGSFAHTLLAREPGALQTGLRALERSPVYATLPSRLRSVAELVVDELASNAIKYGGPDCREVRFTLDFDGRLMRVSVMDDGLPFNPWLDAPAVESAATDVAALKIGGRGIHMIRQATDSQHYQRRDGQNISTLTRHWHPPESCAPVPAAGFPSP